ncbi:MAG TPA: hypothetical protein VNO52_18345, partial [Methylomirabilota bacterium]|nr:hypothetical protein [Methylomirabilota bacterium]
MKSAFLLPMVTVLTACPAFLPAAAGAEGGAAIPAGYHLLYEQKFDRAEALADFAMTDPGAWHWAETNGNGALALSRQSRYQPVVRSPVNIALIADRVFGDFILEADLIQTGKEYGHRDMCIFYGFQNPTNFYYTHLATAADKNAHNVFLVKNAPRTNIAHQTTQGVNWGLGVWHKVRIERKASEGTIKVFFDDLTRPIMLAEDRSFAWGQIGFGSFDDTGMVDNIRIWGPSVERRKTAGFPAP